MKVTFTTRLLTLFLLSIGMEVAVVPVVEAASLRLMDDDGKKPLPVGSYRKSRGLTQGGRHPHRRNHHHNRRLVDETIVKDSTTRGCGKACENDDDYYDDDDDYLYDDDFHDDDYYRDDDDYEAEVSMPTYNRQYGRFLTVDYDIPDDELNKYVYIGVFEEVDGELFDDYPLALWSGTCGSQKSKDTCNSGSIIFDIQSGHEEDQYFPIRPAMYQVCIMDETPGYPGTKLDCVDLKVRKLKQDQIDDTTISAPDEEYTIDDENVIIDFTSPEPIEGQWIGLISVYEFNNLKDDDVLPDKEFAAWTYSGGCDKDDYKKCWKDVDDGTVEIVHGKFKYDDTYKPCLVYDMNEPYKQWKCGPSFKVYSDEAVDDD